MQPDITAQDYQFAMEALKTQRNYAMDQLADSQAGFEKAKRIIEALQEQLRAVTAERDALQPKEEETTHD